MQQINGSEKVVGRIDGVSPKECGKNMERAALEDCRAHLECAAIEAWEERVEQLSSEECTASAVHVGHAERDIIVAEIILELRNIVKFFPPNRRVLNQISLAINKGETIRILGRSGSGKTLLTDILTGQVVPDSGEVLVDGLSLSGMPEKERSFLRYQTFAVLGREPGFFHSLSMMDNVTLPLILMGESGKIARKRAAEAMEWFDVERAAIRKPSQLSITEARRMQLVRASLLSPEIIVADSFTAGLSEEAEWSLWQQLKKLQAENGSTLIHLTDEIGGTGAVDRTWRLSDGFLCKNERDKCSK